MDGLVDGIDNVLQTGGIAVTGFKWATVCAIDCSVSDVFQNADPAAGR